MLSSIAGIVLGALFQALREWLADRRAEQTLKDLGRAEGAAATSTVIAEKADAQAKVNAADRGSATDVARRLRERLAKPGPQ